MPRMEPLFRVALLAFLAPLVFEPAAAMRVVDSLHTSSKWKYITRFCFKNSGATFSVNMKQFTTNGTVTLNLYADMESAWPRIYRNRHKWPCSWLAGNATASVDISNVPMTIRIYGMRDRWWFVTASNCDGDGIDLWYNLTFLNPAAISNEFSADEIGVLQTLIVFFVLMTIVLLWVIYSWFRLKFGGLQYGITKRLMISTTLHEAGLLCSLIHYAKFAKDGVGTKTMDEIGQFFDICSEMSLLLLVVFLAKGYKVSGRHLAHKRLLILCYLPFPIAYFALYIYSILGVDPASTLYIYESPPGYLIIVLHILAFVWLAAVLVRTWRIEKDNVRRIFYAIFGAVYSLWLLAVPVVVLIMHFVGAWARKKVVTAVDEIILLVALAFLSMMFRPDPIRSKLVEKMKYDTSFDNPMQVFPSAGP